MLLKKIEKEFGFKINYYFYNGLIHSSYITHDEYDKLSESIVKKLKSSPDYSSAKSEDLKRLLRKIQVLSDELFHSDFKKINNEGLLRIIKSLKTDLSDLFFYTFIHPFMKTEMAFGLMKILPKDKHEILLGLADDGEASKEIDEFLEIVNGAYKNGLAENYRKRLAEHAQKYSYLSVKLFSDKLLGTQDFENSARMVMDEIDPKILIDVLAKERDERKKMFTAELAKITDKAVVSKILLFQDYLSGEYSLREALRKFESSIAPLLKEVADRTSYSYEEAQLLTLEEMISALNGEVFDDLEMNRRKLGWAILVWETKMQIVPRHEFISQIINDYGIIAENENPPESIAGNVASQGVASGKVKVIHSETELNKIEKGDILVAKTTSPDYGMAMGRAAGVITDEGGVTCHAALVSRELGIPCIIATQVASERLHDGDPIILDGDEGKVWIIGQNKKTGSKEISGKILNRGKVKGALRELNSILDFAKVGKDDIVVLEEIWPELLPGLLKSAGFIVKNNSLFAQVYSKVLSKPCLLVEPESLLVPAYSKETELDCEQGFVKVSSSY